jgi:predicted HicB family RNase H-like nuclease
MQKQMVTSRPARLSDLLQVQVPKSLHRFLAEEAQAEGVCLDLLILAKISIPLYDMIMALKK